MAGPSWRALPELESREDWQGAAAIPPTSGLQWSEREQGKGTPMHNDPADHIHTLLIAVSAFLFCLLFA